MNRYQLYSVSRQSKLDWIPFLFLSGKSDEADLRFGKNRRGRYLTSRLIRKTCLRPYLVG
jgi:hypothetical protein